MASSIYRVRLISTIVYIGEWFSAFLRICSLITFQVKADQVKDWRPCSDWSLPLTAVSCSRLISCFPSFFFSLPLKHSMHFSLQLRLFTFQKIWRSSSQPCWRNGSIWNLPVLIFTSPCDFCLYTFTFLSVCWSTPRYFSNFTSGPVVKKKKCPALSTPVWLKTVRKGGIGTMEDSGQSLPLSRGP